MSFYILTALINSRVFGFIYSQIMVCHDTDFISFRVEPCQSEKLLCSNCLYTAAGRIWFASHVLLFTLLQICGCKNHKMFQVSYYCPITEVQHDCLGSGCYLTLLGLKLAAMNSNVFFLYTWKTQHFGVLFHRN